MVVPLGVPRAFSYAVPAELVAAARPGTRVRVPFRGRARPGVVVEVRPGGVQGLEAVEAVLDPVPALTPSLLVLARWAADETASAWGEAVFRALPPGSAAGAPAGLPPEAAPWPAVPPLLVHGAERAVLIEAAIDRSLGAGGAVLVLAPEIDLAAAWARRLRTRAGDAVMLATSAETPRRRWQAWWAGRTGAARVVVGTRGAAFLPLRPLALVVVLDEEDPAHKAPDAPRWHARELVLHRVAFEGGAALLGSAAPSLESWVRARGGAMRAEARDGPGRAAVHVVDLGPGDQPGACLSPGLADAAAAAVARGEVVALVLERVGFGRGLACAECGAVRRCERCRVALTFHREARTLECRLCGTRWPARSLCGRCRGRRLEPLGWGTEAVEAEARRALPGAAVVRYDGTLDAQAAARARAAVAAGGPIVLVGTRMAARLLVDRPAAVAALVLADTTLALPDFRAGERTYQLACRLAEAVAPGGSLWVQSRHPGHHAFTALATGDRERFYAVEWAERQELGYPPARRMARVVVEGREGAGLAEGLAERAREAGVAVLGPAAVPGGRAQVVLLGDDGLPRAVAGLLAPFRGRRRLGRARLIVDVDPVELP